MGFEPTTLGFGVQCSTVGATPSLVNSIRQKGDSSGLYLIKLSYKRR